MWEWHTKNHKHIIQAFRLMGKSKDNKLVRNYMHIHSIPKYPKYFLNINGFITYVIFIEYLELSFYLPDCSCTFR